MRALNTLLCIVCVGIVVAIVATHRDTRDTAPAANAPVGYLSELDAWALVTAPATVDRPEDPFRGAGPRAVGTAPTVSATAQALAEHRWHARLEEAAAILEEPPAPVRMPMPDSKAGGYTPEQRENMRRQRRARSLFELTRHYDENRRAYENSSERNRPRPRSDRYIGRNVRVRR